MRRTLLISLASLFLACGNNNNNNDETCNDQLDNDGDGAIDCNDDDCAADAACGAPPAVVGGFESPESVFFDTETTAWYVTNQGGNGVGDGFVSKLDAAGNVLDREFATGLDNPRGARAVNGNLFVADDTGVTVIDLSNGQILRTVAIPGNNFLNDVTVDPATGDVFVSDSGTNTIHRLPGGDNPVVFIQDNQLNFPNGLLFEDGTMLVASFNSGQIFSVNLAADPSILVISGNNDLGSLDGLERDGQNLLTSDFNGRLLSVDANGNFTVLVDTTDVDFDAAADIAFDPARRIVAVPELFGTEVNFFDLDAL